MASDTTIQKALQKTRNLQQENNKLVLEIRRLREDNEVELVSEKVQRIDSNKDEIRSIRDNVGLKYAVWMVVNPNTDQETKDVISPLFEDIIEADSYLVENCKKNEVKGKLEYVVHDTVQTKDNNYKGFW